MLSKTILATLTCSLLLFISGCQTSDSTMRDQGHADAYVLGFHDGRHSGMKEAGNNWEHHIKDAQRFQSEIEYREGWLAGEVEGKKLQAQATNAGEAIGNGYTGYRVGEEVKKSQAHPKKIANDAMKGVDTGELKALEK